MYFALLPGRCVGCGVEIQVGCNDLHSLIAHILRQELGSHPPLGQPHCGTK